jgi:hypothetical protein
MTQNRFKAYLERRRPFGDSVDLPFVERAIADRNLPDPASWEELESYLRENDAAEDDLKAAKHVWQLYLEER